MYQHNIKALILFVLIISLGFSSKSFSAENKIDSLKIDYYKKQATKAFNKNAYVKAIEIYEKLINQGCNDTNIYRNIAEAYYKIGQPEEAEKWYQHIVNNFNYGADDVYMYAQVLKYNGKHVESDLWMKKFAELKPEDSRAKRQVDSYEMVEKIKATKLYKIDLLHINSENSEFGPTLMGDTLFYTSEHKKNEVLDYEYAWKETPFLDIFATNLSDSTITETNFLKMKVNSKFHDGPACFSKDKKEMFFTRNSTYLRFLSRKGKNKTTNLKIFYLTLTDKRINSPVALPFNSDEYSCAHPCLSYDESTLYFSSDMPGGFGGSDIYMVHRTDTGWTEPQNLGQQINTEGDEMFPFINELGILYFASNGHKGLGGLDIFKAEGKGSSYQVENMGFPLNSEKDDFSMITNPDMEGGYFASNRPGGIGSDDIYSFVFLEFKNKKGLFTCQIISSNKKFVTRGLRVNILDDFGNLIKEVTTDVNGEFDIGFSLDNEVNYIIDLGNSFVKVDYDLLKEYSENKTKLKLYLDDYVVLFGKLVDQTSGELVPDMKVTITDLDTKEKRSIISPNGEFSYIAESDKFYTLKTQKEGYLTKVSDFNTEGVPPGEEVNLNIVTDLEAVEVKEGETDLTTAINLKPIYFDFASYEITEKAIIELQKVVVSMRENPTMLIELNAHTDCVGDDDFNLKLSDKRAGASAQYIVDQGIDITRITSNGFGETQLINNCACEDCSDEEHAVNRRTEFKIVKF